MTFRAAGRVCGEVGVAGKVIRSGFRGQSLGRPPKRHKIKLRTLLASLLDSNRPVSRRSPSHLAVLGQARSHPEWLRGLKWRPPSARSIAVSNEPVSRRSERDPRDGLSISGVRARDSQARWLGSSFITNRLAGQRNGLKGKSWRLLLLTARSPIGTR